jgi:hypothetical protein
VGRLERGTMKDRAHHLHRTSRVLAVLFPAAALMIAVVLVPASAANSEKKPKPSPGFSISVTTKSYVKAVGPTKTDLKLEVNGRVIFHGRASVEKLGYRDSQRHTWTIAHLKADPGFLEPVAIADATDAVHELNEHNLKAAPRGTATGRRPRIPGRARTASSSSRATSAPIQPA